MCTRFACIDGREREKKKKDRRKQLEKTTTTGEVFHAQYH